MAYWNINYNYNIDVKSVEIVELLTSIKCYCEIIKDIPIGNGLRNEFINIDKKPDNILKGTFKDDIIIKDIIGTTAIEGNVLGVKDVTKVLTEENPKNVQEKEVLNIKKVREYIQKVFVKKYGDEITEGLIKEINSIVLEGIEDEDAKPGEYRKYNVIVGKNHKPPKFEDVPQKMKEFILFINSDEIKKINPMLRAMMAHFYLVSIHPFGNGNGRTSRALEAYLFYYNGFNVHGFFSLNNYYYKNYDEYFKALDEARFKYKGSLQEFVKFCLKGYLLELKNIATEVKKFTIVKHYENYAKELFTYKEITLRQFSLLEYIESFDNKYTEQQYIKLEVPIIKGLYENIRTERTIQRDIKALLDFNLIKIENGYLGINFDVMNEFCM